MRKSVEVEINLTAQEIANMIWNMYDDEQIELLEILAKIDKPGYILMQMQAISDVLKMETTDTKNCVKTFVKELYEYLCEGE